MYHLQYGRFPEDGGGPAIILQALVEDSLVFALRTFLNILELYAYSNITANFLTQMGP